MADPQYASSIRHLLWQIILAILLIAIFATLLVLYNNKDPSLNLQINSVAVSSFNVVNDGHVTGTWNLGFQIRHKSTLIFRIKLYYAPFNVSIFYENQTLLAWRSLGSLDDVQEVFVRVDANKVPYYYSRVDDVGVLVRRFLEDLREDGIVGFNVIVKIGVHVRTRNIFVKTKVDLLVVCRDLKVRFLASDPTSGILIGGSRKCLH